MYKLPCLLLPVLLILSSCGYKSHYLKSDLSQSLNAIDEVVVFVEYLHLKDDLGELWDFDEDKNLKYQDVIFENAINMLLAKGYKVSQSNIKSSGINLDKRFVVEHYQNKQLQSGVISPPFMIRTENLNSESVQGFEYLLSELFISLNPNYVDRGIESQNYLDTMNFKELLQNIDINENSAILIVQSTQFATSVLKNIGVGLLYGAAANSSRAHVQIGFNQHSTIPAVHAYLVHKGSGDLLWSNYQNHYIKTSTSHTLYDTFPVKAK